MDDFNCDKCGDEVDMWCGKCYCCPECCGCDEPAWAGYDDDVDGADPFESMSGNVVYFGFDDEDEGTEYLYSDADMYPLETD